MGQGSRPERVADQIRAEVSSLIARDLQDPGIGFITITRVQVSPDLQHARVYYTSLGDASAREALGKSARCVDRDPAPPQFQQFPGVAGIRVASAIDEPADAVIVMECGALSRTGVKGFEEYFIINIDHHPGNSMYGAVN